MLVTHDARTFEYADRIIEIEDGRVRASTEDRGSFYRCRAEASASATARPDGRAYMEQLIEG